jgi:receptor protein-tyrosine kinase
MDSIEEAARRLEELRRAGATVVPTASRPHAGPVVPTPEAVMRALERTEPSVAPPVPPPVRNGAVNGAMALDPGRVRTQPGAPQPAHDAPAPRHVSIDLARLRSMGYITPDAPQSRIADEFRVIKRPIIRNVVGEGERPVKQANLVMVTSAVPGEGKTFTSVNLALSIAMEFDSTVLLIDGDVANPRIPSLLGVPGQPGLLDLLAGTITVPEALLKTNIDRLSIIPAGTRHRRANELLASAQMAVVLDELSTRYSDRIVIFDSPPLLATTEARVMARHMGQIVMVVAADSTSQHAVTHALATIDGCEVVLMMLNKSSDPGAGAYYGYYGADAGS